MKTVVYDTKTYDRESLEPAGKDKIEWSFQPFRLDKESAEAARGAQAICIFVNDKADRPVLDDLSSLGVKHIALRCAGFNGVDIPAATQLGFTVTRVPAYSPYAVAEHAIGLLLAVNRKIPRANNRVHNLNFSLNALVGFDLHGKTAGIIAAEILRGFGMKVLAYDPFPVPDWAKKFDVEYTDLKTLMRDSLVISLHTPLTPETRHIINDETLELMRPGVILINVSRGGLINTKALIKALKASKIGGVGLDVYEEEGGIFFEDLSCKILQDDDLARLLTFRNVLITSHQAFLTYDALAEIARVTVENLTAFAQGRPFLPGTELKEEPREAALPKCA
jgi:D-lactate dehydrogenase